MTETKLHRAGQEALFCCLIAAAAALLLLLLLLLSASVCCSLYGYTQQQCLQLPLFEQELLLQQSQALQTAHHQQQQQTVPSSRSSSGNSLRLSAAGGPFLPVCVHAACSLLPLGAGPLLRCGGGSMRDAFEFPPAAGFPRRGPPAAEAASLLWGAGEAGVYVHPREGGGEADYYGLE
ncbi:hypothetical protein Efla_001302 [Eimeria flavescens]